MPTIPRFVSRSARCALCLVILLTLSACPDPEAAPPASGSGGANASATETEAESSTAGPVRPASEQTKAPRNPNERPIPAFEGLTLSGTRLRIADQLGSRLVILIFNPEVDPSAAAARGVVQIARQSAGHNFEVVGVGVGSSRAKLLRFVDEHEIRFPVIDDSGGEITRLLRLRSPLALIGVDADGYMTFGIGGFPEGSDVEQLVVSRLRESLRLPAESKPAAGELYTWPIAPALGVKAMSDGSVLETEELRGRAAVVIYFLHTCPHCHRALAALEEILAQIEEDKRPRLVAVSVQNSPSGVRSMIKDQGLEGLAPYLDPGGDAADRWGVTGGVPVVLVVDPEGRIRHRTMGWDDRRDPGLVRMKLTKAAGARVPMLLDPKGYSGNDVCGVCHEQEYATWQFTSHATAFDTLVTHASDRRTDCVGCHVVGFEETGGYDFTRRPSHLENVGCESCHGRGGPHLSPGAVTDGDYAPVCGTCHNPTHSLGFEYTSFSSRVSHTRIASLSDAERAELADGGGPQRELLPTRADYVGSDACQSCHAAEFETWAASPHGHAVETLEKQGKADQADCLTCHTTAYGKPGGFAVQAAVADQPDLARVGCESCHGPGGDHVGSDAPRVGTILSLGDKCDSCVILKVCGSCHDDVNDPGFEFAVEERIEAQRHGTIPSAATRAGLSAARDEPRPVPHAAAWPPAHGPEHDGRALDLARIAEALERVAPSDPAPGRG